MENTYLYEKCSARVVEVATLQLELVENCQALVARGIVKVVFARPPTFKMKYWFC